LFIRILKICSILKRQSILFSSFHGFLIIANGKERRRDIYPNEIMEVIIAMNNGSHNLSGEAAFKKIGCGFCFELLYFSLADVVVVAAVAVAFML
jgi:hypothetical protein